MLKQPALFSWQKVMDEDEDETLVRKSVVGLLVFKSEKLAVAGFKRKFSIVN